MLLVLFMCGTRTNISEKRGKKIRIEGKPNSNPSYPKLYLSSFFCFQFEVIFMVERAFFFNIKICKLD